MPNSCSVPNCTSRRGGHGFPLKDRDRVQQWLRALRMESYVPKKYSIVCRNHFTDDDYELPKDSVLNDPRLILKRDAVPKIFIGKAMKGKEQNSTDSKKSNQNTVNNQNITNYHFKDNPEQLSIKNEFKIAPMAVNSPKPPEYIIPDTEIECLNTNTETKESNDNKVKKAPLISQHSDQSCSKEDMNLVICEKALEYFSSKFPCQKKAHSSQSPLNKLIPTLPPDVTITRAKASTNMFSLDRPYTYSWKNDEDNMKIKVKPSNRTTQNAVDIEVECNIDEPCQDFAIQCNLCQCASLEDTIKRKFCIDHVMDIENPEEVQYFTGFKDYDRFKYMFNLLGADVNNLSYNHTNTNTSSNLTPRDAFLLTVMKLRRNKPFIELAYQFRISKEIVPIVFKSWIKFLFDKFRRISDWMPANVIRKYMRYGKGKPTIVIVECTGIQLKVKNTDNHEQKDDKYTLVNPDRRLKVYIDMTESGSSKYVSKAFPGSLSDNDLIKKCTLEAEIQCNGDKIDLTEEQPKTYKKIEKVIGLSKLYTILNGKLDCELVDFAHEVVFVCCMLTNFIKKPNNEGP